MPEWNEAAWFSWLAGAALKSTLVLGAAWLAAVVLRRRSAAAQHLVWTAAAVALLSLPLLSVAVPAVRVTVPAGLTPPGLIIQTTAVERAQGAGQWGRPRFPGVRLLAGQSGLPSGRGSLPHQTARLDWRLALLLLWAAGWAVAMAQMLIGCAALRRIRRTAHPFHDPQTAGLIEALGIDARVDVLEARAGSMPASFGLLRPVVLMPADAANWTAGRRRIVLLHELAHVRRGDHATHLLARAALSLYWWNPLAWTAWREFLKARERAADDVVLSAGAAPPDYAGHLLEIARTMQEAPALGRAAIAMARPSQLEGRLLAILDSTRSRKPHGRASAWAAGFTAAAIIIPLAALQAQSPLPAPPPPPVPQVVFRDGGPVSPDVQSLPPAVDTDVLIRAAAARKDHEMLEQAAKKAEALRNYAAARTLLDSSAAIREQASGQASVSYGIGLVKIGDLERERGNYAEAEAFYQKALTAFQGAPESAGALKDLGLLALTYKPNAEYDAAFDYFARAQIADPAQSGVALMWQAITRDRQERPGEAETLYKSAIAAQDPNTPQAATILELYSRFLSRNDRAAEAAALKSQADAVRQALVVKGDVAVKAQETATAPAPGSGALRVGGGVTAPQLMHKVEPQYSEEARAAKFEGAVVLYVEVGIDGLAHNVHVLRSLGLDLDQKAMDAVSQWQFKPGMKDGVPVTVQATIEVNFRLL